jgi:hypothetical protein
VVLLVPIPDQFEHPGSMQSLEKLDRTICRTVVDHYERCELAPTQEAVKREHKLGDELASVEVDHDDSDSRRLARARRRSPRPWCPSQSDTGSRGASDLTPQEPRAACTENMKRVTAERIHVVNNANGTGDPLNRKRGSHSGSGTAPTHNLAP